MSGMHEFDVEPYGPRWWWRSSPFFYIGGVIFCFFAAIDEFGEGGLSMALVVPLLMIPLFTYQAWWWWRYGRKPPYIRLKDGSIEFRQFGTAEVENVPLGQIQRLNFAGGNAIFKLPNENQVQVPYTRRTFELTQEAKSKLAGWAKAHGIEVVG